MQDGVSVIVFQGEKADCDMKPRAEGKHRPRHAVVLRTLRAHAPLPFRHVSHPRGFTLIELMVVVIVMIVILLIACTVAMAMTVIMIMLTPRHANHEGNQQ